nr:cache domain-containing protein [Lachnospiraceae bacterium]
MKKRKQLKQILLSHVIAYVAIIIVIITAINLKMQNSQITELTESVLSKESVSYASEVYNWWSLIEQRVRQTADVVKNSSEMSYDDTLAMLLKLTELDPDSQDIYMAFGDTGTFLDGSGWIPDDTFVFTDRPWYTGAISKGGEIYTSEPYVDASTGKTCLACAVMIRDQVVLSSDINFDKVAERMNDFKSSSPDAKFYIINKETKDILVSNADGVVGQTVPESTDPIMQGLNGVIDSLNTVNAIDVDKVQTVKTGAGKMMFAATDIAETSWIVVSAVPYTVVSSN